MSKISFSHLVEIDESSRQLTIYRMFPGGEKQLYTQIDLPTKKLDEDKEAFGEFARNIGENILIDSPVARTILSI